MDVSKTIDTDALAASYRQLTGGSRQWLSYHLAEGRITPFGRRLLDALRVCEARLPGSAARFIRELASTRYVNSKTDAREWQRGYEQLVQKLAEILVTRVVFEASWPVGSTFFIEPLNTVTGSRPEIVVEAPNHQWLFEVKCPSFIEYQARRAERGRQLPVRGPLGGMSEIRDGATLPRDNTLKDFLESAQTKFAHFSGRDRTGVLVVLWDGYVFEATSALSHPDAGLLTARSWHTTDATRVPFDAVDGVVVLNHLEILKLAPQEQPTRREDPFTVGGEGQPPNVWCPNLGRSDLDPFVAGIFDAHSLEALSGAADYTPKDYVMWLNTKDPET